MIRAGIATSISVALLALVGCATKPVPTGRYRGERSLPIAPGTDPAVADQLRRVQITFKEDGTAVLEDGGVPFEGEVSRHGDELYFEVLAIAGINAKRQDPALTRARTWKILSDGSIQAGGVRLTRYD